MKISPIDNKMLANIDSPEFFGDLTVPEPLVSDNDTSPATKLFVENATKAYSHYYRNCYNVQTIATNWAENSKLIFDTSGNLYYAVSNQYNGTYNVTSYIYKITPNGTISTFASAATNGTYSCSLAFDTSGNLYWAIANAFNGSSVSITSYVYKITPAGSMTTFASVATNAASDTDIKFDSSGNLFWSVANQQVAGPNFNINSAVYKITSSGTLTTFAIIATNGAVGTSLTFDTSGNLYCLMMNSYNGSSYNIPSYVYKITPAGSITTFATATTNGASTGELIFDNEDNLYWAALNYYNGSYKLTSYIYKITPAGNLTTFASIATSGASGASLKIDTSGNLYWSIGNYYNDSSFNLTSYIYKITPAGNLTIFASIASIGGYGSGICFDTNENLYWAQTNHHNGSTGNLNSYLHVMTKHSIV